MSVAGQADLNRRILNLAVPALGALATDPLVSLVDTFFVGRLGAVALAALGVDVAIFGFAFFAFIFLSYATTPMVANARGAGDLGLVGRVSLQAGYLALWIGVIAAVGLVLFAPYLVEAMGAPAQVAAPAIDYLRLRALAAPAVQLITVGHGVYRGLANTKTAFRIAVLFNLVNAVLVPILVVPLGLNGAAVANVFAQYLGAVLFLVGFNRMRLSSGWAWQRPRWRELHPFLRAGGTLFIRTSFLLATLTYATSTAARLGTAVVAGHQIARDIWLFLAMSVDALAVAGQTLVAEAHGAGAHIQGWVVAKRLSVMGLGLGLVFGLAIVAGRYGLAGIFSSDPAVVAAAAEALLVTGLMQPLAALVFVGDGVFVGAQAFRLLAWSTAVGALVGVSAISMLAPRFGLAGVWWGITAMLGGRAIVLASGRRIALDQPGSTTPM